MCGKGQKRCCSITEARNHHSATPLGRAAASGNVPGVRLLLERGADETACILRGGGKAEATVVAEIAAILS